MHTYKIESVEIGHEYTPPKGWKLLQLTANSVMNELGIESIGFAILVKLDTPKYRGVKVDHNSSSFM